MTFSLAYTTCRPQCVWERCGVWVARAETPKNVEIVIAIDEEDTATLMAANATVVSFNTKIVTQPDKPYNCVKGWNLAAKNCTGDVIICISDDFTPPHGWDKELANLQPKDWHTKQAAVHVNDNFVVKIMTIPILTKLYYLRYGRVFYEEYESMFCDTDFTEQAYSDGVVIDAKHLVFEHHHYNRQHRNIDEHDKVHGSQERWNKGEEIFNRRKKLFTK